MESFLRYTYVIQIFRKKTVRNKIKFKNDVDEYFKGKWNFLIITKLKENKLINNKTYIN